MTKPRYHTFVNSPERSNPGRKHSRDPIVMLESGLTTENGKHINSSHPCQSACFPFDQI